MRAYGQFTVSEVYDGDAGSNSATVHLFQRPDEGAEVDIPTGPLTYTFATGGLTPAEYLGSWTTTVPAANGRPLWMTMATVIGDGETATILRTAWSEPITIELDPSALNEAIDEISTALNNFSQEIENTYYKKAEFNNWAGEFFQSAELLIEAAGNQIAETFGLTELITSVTTLAADLKQTEAYLTQMDGQIRRGFLENPAYPDDPDAPEYVFGIAVSSQLDFKSVVKYTDKDGNLVDEEDLTDEDPGVAYTELNGEQTLALYTSTGWQFWIGGQMRGWFDSSDGELHVVQETIEDRLTQGLWQITTIDGWGLKYLG